MNTHFVALRRLAASNVGMRTQNAVAEEEHTFQWYVSEVDRFIVGVDIEKLRTTFSLLNVSETSKQKLHTWLNEFTIIWNRWRGDIHIGFSDAYILSMERAAEVEDWFDYAIGILEELKKRPEDESLKKDFISSLSILNRKLYPVQKVLKNLLDNMAKFISSFDRQQKILADICVQACTEVGVKKEQIESIEKIIDGYEKSIADLKNAIIALGVVDGLGILGTIGAIFGACVTGGFMLALLVPCLPIIGCTSYMITKFKLEIDQLNDQIEEKKKEQQELKDDIVGLITFDKTIKGISEENSKIEEYVRKAKQPWDALSEDLDNILADISVLDKGAGSVYDDYLVSFKEAKELWTETFIPGIQQLKVEDIRVVNTPDGFTIEKPEDWEEALNKYSVSIDEYFSNKSA